MMSLPPPASAVLLVKSASLKLRPLLRTWMEVSGSEELIFRMSSRNIPRLMVGSPPVTQTSRVSFGAVSMRRTLRLRQNSRSFSVFGGSQHMMHLLLHCAVTKSTLLLDSASNLSFII